MTHPDATRGTMASPAAPDHPADREDIAPFEMLLRSHRRRDFGAAARARRALFVLGVSTLVRTASIGEGGGK